MVNELWYQCQIWKLSAPADALFIKMGINKKIGIQTVQLGNIVEGHGID